MRLPWPALAAGVVVTVLGVGGLVRGAMPQAAPAVSSPASTSTQPIVVSGAYVHGQVPPTDTAAGYFTIDNTTSKPDRLLSVESGAGASTVLHTTSASGSMMTTTKGVTVPAHGTLRFTPGGNHVMIEQVYGQLAPGGAVNFELDFARAGSIDVTAPVVPLGTDSPGKYAIVPTTDHHGGHH